MENQIQSNLSSNISPLTKNNLLQIASWGRIVAIISFVSAAVGLIRMFKLPGSAMIFSLISTIISVALNYLLFQASVNLKKGIDSVEQGSFNEGLINLMRYFKFYAILLIIAIIFCVLAFLLAIVVGSTYKG